MERRNGEKERACERTRDWRRGGVAVYERKVKHEENM